MICWMCTCCVISPRQVKILDGNAGDVAPGELLAIMGPSGSGKSTLLKSLAGIAELPLCQGKGSLVQSCWSTLEVDTPQKCLELRMVHEHLTSFAGSDVKINGKTFSEVQAASWTATVEFCVDLCWFGHRIIQVGRTCGSTAHSSSKMNSFSETWLFVSIFSSNAAFAWERCPKRNVFKDLMLWLRNWASQSARTHSSDRLGLEFSGGETPTWTTHHPTIQHNDLTTSVTCRTCRHFCQAANGGAWPLLRSCWRSPRCSSRTRPPAAWIVPWRALVWHPELLGIVGNDFSQKNSGKKCKKSGRMKCCKTLLFHNLHESKRLKSWPLVLSFSIATWEAQWDNWLTTDSRVLGPMLLDCQRPCEEM